LGNSVIELYDAGNGQLTEISADAPPLPDGETSAGFSNIPSISADGRYVVFDEKFLIANDQGPPIDASEVLLYDGQSQTVTVVQNFAGHAAISGNGQYIVMQADPPPDSNNNSNGESVLVADRSGNVLTDIAGDPDFVPQGDSNNFGGAGSVYDPAISSDGRFVTFWTTAAEITVDGTVIQTNNSTGNAEVYVYDRQNDELQTVSVGEQGQPGNGERSKTTTTLGPRRSAPTVAMWCSRAWRPIWSLGMATRTACRTSSCTTRKRIRPRLSPSGSKAPRRMARAIVRRSVLTAITSPLPAPPPISLRPTRAASSDIPL
jgi:hypothetical protein